MLFPRVNQFRQAVDLSGFWDLRFDPELIGVRSGWSRGFTSGRPVAVPASWNDQFESSRDYLGQTWYQTRFDLPRGFEVERERIGIRFGSVNYLAEAWLNGVLLGEHEGGHLPFEFDVGQHLQARDNLLVVRVDGELAPDRVPQGMLHDAVNVAPSGESLPDVNGDFFPYCGIHRPVLLHSSPPGGLSDLTVTTGIDGSSGIVAVTLVRADDEEAIARVSIQGTDSHAEFAIRSAAEATLVVPNARFWSPESPHLYTLIAELSHAGEVFDQYTLPFGVRTITVDGSRLLLNGEPVYLRGFGRHEDFPISGRGLNPAVIIKDYALMKWLGANSFRTSHYPYSDEMMDLADRLGFLVIDETPANALTFDDPGNDRRLRLSRQYVRDLVARDKNHPSVVIWSLANEPDSLDPRSPEFVRDLYDLCKSLDPTRPATIVSYAGAEDEAFHFLDILTLNRYRGWYSELGRLDAALTGLNEDLDAMDAKFRKPLILTEFGADAVAGIHAHPPELFSEEFQADLIEGYIAVLRTKPFVVGEHIWNLCDFKTSQNLRRVGGLNSKGVFTRDRRPKLAAHRVRAIWSGTSSSR